LKVLIQFIAVGIALLFTILKEVSTKGSYGLADSRDTQQTRVGYTSKLDW
jgi:hypothetical protein